MSNTYFGLGIKKYDGDKVYLKISDKSSRYPISYFDYYVDANNNVYNLVIDKRVIDYFGKNPYNSLSFELRNRNVFEIGYRKNFFISFNKNDFLKWKLANA